MSDEYIKSFYNKVCNTLEGDYKIILEPKRSLQEEWIEYDNTKWELEEDMIELIRKLSENNKMTFEEKLLNIYKYICLNYIYDDNVLYFFRRDISDPENIKYIAVDWYGRIPDSKWIENRKKHNRRICYEFSRFYAKAINMLLDNENMEAFMLGDKENLHYVTALAGKEYSIILDLDNFNSIKDLTRLKLGLSLKGIKILEDNSAKITNAVTEFNKNLAVELSEIESAQLEKVDILDYLYKVVDILKKCNLDSQGFCEYIRSLIEKEGITVDKIWKQVTSFPEKRYARCLVFDFEKNTYLLDSIDQTLSILEIEKLDKSIFILKPEENEYPYFGG